MTRYQDVSTIISENLSIEREEGNITIDRLIQYIQEDLDANTSTQGIKLLQLSLFGTSPRPYNKNGYEGHVLIMDNDMPVSFMLYGTWAK